MEIWNEREYIMWCGICGWEIPVSGVDVQAQEEKCCPNCGSDDYGIRERNGKPVALLDLWDFGITFSDNGRGGLEVEDAGFFRTEHCTGDLAARLGMKDEDDLPS